MWGAMPLLVYYDLNPCINVSVGSLVPGNHALIFSVDGDRPDLPAIVKLPITPSTNSCTIHYLFENAANR